jgi:hypothetical protein
LKQQLHPDGHLVVDLRNGGKRRMAKVHQLVLEAFVGSRPGGMEGCHNNGDGTDNRVENLRWDTPSENNFDLVRHGTHFQARKAHCPREHLLIEPNLATSKLKHGWRECESCRLERKWASRHGEPFSTERADARYQAIMTTSTIQAAA